MKAASILKRVVVVSVFGFVFIGPMHGLLLRIRSVLYIFKKLQSLYEKSNLSCSEQNHINPIVASLYVESVDMISKVANFRSYNENIFNLLLSSSSRPSQYARAAACKGWASQDEKSHIIYHHSHQLDSTRGGFCEECRRPVGYRKIDGTISALHECLLLLSEVKTCISMIAEERFDSSRSGSGSSEHKHSPGEAKDQPKHLIKDPDVVTCVGDGSVQEDEAHNGHGIPGNVKVDVCEPSQKCGYLCGQKDLFLLTQRAHRLANHLYSSPEELKTGEDMDVLIVIEQYAAVLTPFWLPLLIPLYRLSKRLREAGTE